MPVKGIAKKFTKSIAGANAKDPLGVREPYVPIPYSEARSLGLKDFSTKKFGKARVDFTENKQDALVRARDYAAAGGKRKFYAPMVAEDYNDVDGFAKIGKRGGRTVIPVEHVDDFNYEMSPIRGELHQTMWVNDPHPGDSFMHNPFGKHQLKGVYLKPETEGGFNAYAYDVDELDAGELVQEFNRTRVTRGNSHTFIPPTGVYKWWGKGKK